MTEPIVGEVIEVPVTQGNTLGAIRELVRLVDRMERGYKVVKVSVTVEREQSPRGGRLMRRSRAA